MMLMQEQLLGKRMRALGRGRICARGKSLVGRAVLGRRIVEDAAFRHYY